jgi:hypothetical protein
LLRCSGVARSRRGYQKRGTLITRPSRSETDKVSVVMRTSCTRSSALGAAKILIPFVEQKVLPFHDDIPNLAQFNLGKPMVAGQRNRRQPKFAGASAFINVNVGRFRGFVTVKVELKTLLAQNRGHSPTLFPQDAAASDSSLVVSTWDKA